MPFEPSKPTNIHLRKKEYVLSMQALKSGASIGANIAEANGAISEAEFSSKISMASQEYLEAKYLAFEEDWLHRPRIVREYAHRC